MQNSSQYSSGTDKYSRQYQNIDNRNQMSSDNLPGFNAVAYEDPLLAVNTRRSHYRRKRTTPTQLVRMMEVFQNITDTPTFEQREALSKELHMTNREVQVWFQNRRAKMAKLKAEWLKKEATGKPPPFPYQTGAFNSSGSLPTGVFNDHQVRANVPKGVPPFDAAPLKRPPVLVVYPAIPFPPSTDVSPLSLYQSPNPPGSLNSKIAHLEIEPGQMKRTKLSIENLVQVLDESPDFQKIESKTSDRFISFQSLPPIKVPLSPTKVLNGPYASLSPNPMPSGYLGTQTVPRLPVSKGSYGMISKDKALDKSDLDRSSSKSSSGNPASPSEPFYRVTRSKTLEKNFSKDLRKPNGSSTESNNANDKFTESFSSKLTSSLSNSAK